MISNKNTLWIGIDPAFRANGYTIAIIDATDSTVRFIQFKNGFIDFIGWFLHESPDQAVVCVENSNLQNKTFKVAEKKSAIKKQMMRKGKSAKQAEIIADSSLHKMSRDVGKNQAISQNTVDLLMYKYPVVDISPKDKGAKWDQQRFEIELKKNKHIVNKKRSNQDERDAYALALIALKKPYLAKKL